MINQNSSWSRPRRNHPLRTVLIGTSLESESDQVVRSGLAVARATGGQVYLVHAAQIEPPLACVEAGLGSDFVQEQVAWRKEKLRQQIERAGIGKAELAGLAVLSGVPYRILTDVARRITADLIVVGATGSGPLAAELLGSTADRVVRKSPCPVLVARGELRLPLRRVLAPVDLSPLSKDAFRFGLNLVSQLAWRGEAEVRAVYALSFLDALALQLQTQKAGEISVRQAEHEEGELLRLVLEGSAETHLHLEAAVLQGEARFEILREASRNPVDLVMLGTHGRGGLDRLVLGSVASTVARKASCSVLLISPEAALAKGLVEAFAVQTVPTWHCAVALVD